MTWAAGPLAGLDTETTSVDPETARIVSAALVLDDPQNSKLWVKEWLINPGADIPLEATAVHGISTEHAQNHGMAPAQALREILAALALIRQEYGPVPLVLVNACYDLTILDREIRRHSTGDGLTLSFPIIDTLVCDRALDKYRRGRRTLTATAAAYGIAISKAHTAAGDVQCAIKLARAMAARFPAFGSASLGWLQDMQRKAAADWAANFQAFRSLSEPGFTCDGSWPYRPAAGPVTTGSPPVRMT
jgi:DNA polymerase-3 subunit epsilon